MERHVKERLVGAAVLMAAAIILIPEMLSGPDHAERPAQAAARAPSETGLKTYSIDLNNPPGTTNPQSVPDERAPPPEEASLPAQRTQERESGSPITAPLSASEHESNPEPAPQGAPTPPQASQPAARVSSAAPETQAAVERPAAAAKPVVTEPSRAPLASASSVPTSRGWAVQLGSFSSRESAERLAADFRAGRNDVFVMPVKSGATTLYRVRIGPMQNRDAAEETLRRVKVKVSGAAVVAHP